MPTLSPREAATSLEVGQRLLDRYAVIDRIGDGGMAAIYRANDERLDRVVCVKLLKLDLSASGSSGAPATVKASYAHFVREALALSKLQHPNTLRIYDFGYFDQADGSSTSASSNESTPRGQPFQVSEFLDGGDLAQQIRARGALTPDETLAILDRISGAIAEAHGQNIIHRDIKPSNILFARVGDVLIPKLADFGIAQSNLRKKSRAGEFVETEETEPVVRLFSPRWAAPEQIACEPQGPYTDVYSLALVTVFMLTGRIPFAAKDIAASFSERTDGDAFLVRRLEHLGIAGEVQLALIRALTTDITARTATAMAYFDALRRAHDADARATRGAAAPPMKPDGAAAPNATREESRVAPGESTKVVGGRTVRITDVDDHLDVTLPSPPGTVAGVRLTILPTKPGAYRVNIKGLNCFVVNVGGKGQPRPTPAISADADGTADLVTASNARLGRLTFGFGSVVATPRGDSTERVFDIAGATLVVPFPAGAYALCIDVGPERDVLVMRKRG